MTNSTLSSAQDLLEQILGPEILGKGQELINKAKSTDTAELTTKGKAMFKQAEDALADKLGVDDSADSRNKLRLGTAVTAGALALILRDRSNRKLAALGGLGGLGFLAYKAQQAGKMPQSFDEVMALLKGRAPANHADILLQAMVAAAKADGDISDDELAMLDTLEGVEAQDVREVLSAQADPSAIAALAKSDQMALEIYGVSCRIANGLNPRERDYLDRLAMELRLDPEMAARIETDVRTG